MKNPSYEGARTLVAGGLGFIGSNLAIRLVELGADLDVLIPEHGTAEQANGEVYNLGHPEPTSVRGFAETLLKGARGGSLRDVPFPEERVQIDVGSVYADFGKIRGELGWEPETSLREGSRRTVEYARAPRASYW